jgi:hypothetical protein
MSILSELVKQDYGITGRGRWLRSEIHSSLVVDCELDFFYFNAREISGGPLEYLVQVRGWKKTDARKFLENRIFGLGNSDLPSLQVKFTKLIDAFHHGGLHNREYWYKRLLTDSTIDSYKLGFYDGWYLIPIYDGNLFVNFQCRRDEPERKMKLWYRDPDFIPILYNRNILKFVDTIYIVEGMVDCILLNQLGFPSVCSLNGAGYWNSAWIKYFTKTNKIYYVQDNDKAGEFASKKVAKMLGESRVKIVRYNDFPEKFDSMDYFRLGKTPDEFRTYVQTNASYIFDLEI